MRITKMMIILDGNNVGYRIFHTEMKFLSVEDQPTGVIFGFMKTVLQIAQRLKSNKFIFCWDSKERLRCKIDPEYKANRQRSDATPIELAELHDAAQQMQALREVILPAMGFRNIFFRPGYEADDLMAWIVKAHRTPKILATTDNDMFQLLHRCDIFNFVTNNIVTLEDFEARFGIACTKWALAKAIGGCTSDHVRGIKGVSDPKNEKSGVYKYLAGQMVKGKVYERITCPEGQETIRRNLKLVHLPLGGMKNPDLYFQIRSDELNRANFIKIFDRYRFESFLREDSFREWEEAFGL